MTRLQRRNHGKGHSYKLDGTKLVGVTTALNALSKPALIDWASRVTTAYAVDNWDELGALPPSERIDRIGRARWNTTKEAAERGTTIHALGERVSHGDEVEVPDAVRGPVEAYARFLDEWQVETVATETPCAHSKWGYAGTADAWARIGRLGNELVLLDIKTGRGVYDETALQLAAYRFTDLWQPSKGVEEPTPEVAGVYVAHVLPDSVRLLPVEAGEGEWRMFLYALALHKHRELCKDDPLIGSAIQPEDVTA